MKEVNPGESGVQLFSDYAADPAKAGSGNPIELKMLLDQFPYCQLLHLFYTHNLWSAGDNDYIKQIEKATLFVPDRTKLSAILKISEEKEDLAEEILQEDVVQNEETGIEPAKTESENNQNVLIPEEDPEDISEIPVGQNQDIDSNDNRNTTTEEEHEEESFSVNHTYSGENLIKSNPDQISESAFQSENDRPEEVSDAEENNIVEKVLLADEPEIQNTEIENIPVTETPEQQNTTAEEVAITAETEQRKVSKYDDDKMPYSFLWWLNKTRKEHSDTYQPYVEFKLDTSQKIKKASVDQLSSQIIENIFHLQSPLDNLENAPKTVPFQVRHVEDSILEKFIKEEPQIRPPDSHKLDTENKAKKSAEDSNDLVSETLAQIYTDQMLFQKAIDTYKKLSLKFPEKSTYFAVQIRELEKKVN